MLKSCGFILGLVLVFSLHGCSGGNSSGNTGPQIFNPPEPVEFSELIITDTPGDLIGGGVLVTSPSVSGDHLTLTVSHSGGCVENNYICYMFPAAFLESYPVQVNLYIRNDSPPDPCDAIVTATVHYDLTPIGDLYRQQYEVLGRVQLNIWEHVNGVLMIKFRLNYIP